MQCTDLSESKEKNCFIILPKHCAEARGWFFLYKQNTANIQVWLHTTPHNAKPTWHQQMISDKQFKVISQQADKHCPCNAQRNCWGGNYQQVSYLQVNRVQDKPTCGRQGVVIYMRRQREEEENGWDQRTMTEMRLSKCSLATNHQTRDDFLVRKQVSVSWLKHSTSTAVWRNNGLQTKALK